MNDTLTTATDQSTAVHLTDSECDDLVIQGWGNIREAILGWTKNGHSQAWIAERCKALIGKGSPRTIQRHISELRAEGLLPEVGTSDNPEAIRQRKHRAVTNRQNGGMSRPSQPDPPQSVEPPASLASTLVITDEVIDVPYVDTTPLSRPVSDRFNRLMGILDPIIEEVTTIGTHTPHEHPPLARDETRCLIAAAESIKLNLDTYLLHQF
jgi:hypothetical protein